MSSRCVGRVAVQHRAQRGPRGVGTTGCAGHPGHPPSTLGDRTAGRADSAGLRRNPCRRLTEWVMWHCAGFGIGASLWVPPSEPVVGATVMPGDHVAIRWHGDVLVGPRRIGRATVHPDRRGGRRRPQRRRFWTPHSWRTCCRCMPDVEAMSSRPATAAATLHRRRGGRNTRTPSDPIRPPFTGAPWIVLRGRPSTVARSALAGISGCPVWCATSPLRDADRRRAGRPRRGRALAHAVSTASIGATEIDVERGDVVIPQGP